MAALVFDRISLRANLAVSILVMGLLGIVLAILVAESYRKFAIDSQRHSFEQIIGLRVDDLLDELSRVSHDLGQAIQSDSSFREMYRNRDSAAIYKHLESQYHQYFVTAGIIKLESLAVYDTQFNPLSMAISSDSSSDAGCTSLHLRASERQGAARLKTIHELCLVNGKPYFSLLLPIGGLRVSGYMEIVTDPLFSLRVIEQELGLPLQIRYMDEARAYQSVKWPAEKESHVHVYAAYQAKTASGEPAFNLSVVQDIGEFEEDLSATRNTYVLIVGGLSLLLALVMIYWLDRTALVPLHRLMEKLSSIRQDKTRLGEQVAVSGNAEVRDLASGFNEMTNELKHLYDTLLASNEDLSQEISIRQKAETELKKHRDELEVTVKQRTLDLAQARDAALEASRAKSLFLANMSHELRTPLNAIIGYSDMLIEDMEDANESQYIPDLIKVSKAGKHLLTLISEVLDLTKIEAGKMDVFEEWLDLRQLASDVVDTFLPVVERKNNILEVRCSDDIGSIFADVTKLRQAIFNLVGNANKFTNNGKVQFSINKQTIEGNDVVLFSVKDDGIGMTEEQQKKLFKSFSQADISTTREFGGTGLGLVISKRLCEMMNGSIYVESVINEGSVFTIILPVRGRTWRSEHGDGIIEPDNIDFDLESIAIEENKRCIH